MSSFTYMQKGREPNEAEVAELKERVNMALEEDEENDDEEEGMEELV
jgi:hypothetical protein